MFSRLGFEQPHQRLCVEVEAIPPHLLDIADRHMQMPACGGDGADEAASASATSIEAIRSSLSDQNHVGRVSPEAVRRARHRNRHRALSLAPRARKPLVQFGYGRARSLNSRTPVQSNKNEEIAEE